MYSKVHNRFFEKKTMPKEIVIIGGGPGAIEAAKAAAMAGTHVSLVHEGPLGGRAIWETMLPSKAWLHAGDEIVRGHTSRSRSDLAYIAKSWGQHQEQALHKLGANLISGIASFESPERVKVGFANKPGHERVLHGNAFIIATGAIPVFPEGLRPDARMFLHRTCSRLWMPFPGRSSL